MLVRGDDEGLPSPMVNVLQASDRLFLGRMLRSEDGIIVAENLDSCSQLTIGLAWEGASGHVKEELF